MAPLLPTPLLTKPAYRQMSVEEFLSIEVEGRAELIDGMFYMMAGGSLDHATVSGNILIALGNKLRGSGCRPFGPDLGVRTGPASVRLPDASVHCGLTHDADQRRAKLIGDPKMVVEVFSPSTRNEDEKHKLPEYQGLPGVDLIVFVDPDSERVRLVERTGPEGWTDQWLPKGAEVALRALGVTLTADEIFARD